MDDQSELAGWAARRAVDEYANMHPDDPKVIAYREAMKRLDEAMRDCP